jgi:hypothetical protein
MPHIHHYSYKPTRQDKRPLPHHNQKYWHATPTFWCYYPIGARTYLHDTEVYNNHIKTWNIWTPLKPQAIILKEEKTSARHCKLAVPLMYQSTEISARHCSLTVPLFYQSTEISTRHCSLTVPLYYQSTEISTRHCRLTVSLLYQSTEISARHWSH